MDGATNRYSRSPRFTLAELLEYVTLCCVLAALSSVSGIESAFCLMGFALALVCRQGFFALMLLVAASLAGELPIDQSDLPMIEPRGIATLHLVATFTIAGLLCAWYAFRRRLHDPRTLALLSGERSAGTTSDN